MKNLKINKKFVSLLTSGALAISLSGCEGNFKFFGNSKPEETEAVDNSSIYQLYEGKLENDITDNVVIDSGLRNINDLSVVSKETKERLDIANIQVLVNENGTNTLKSINRDITLYLSNDIKAIYYNGKEISLDDYMIIDTEGNEITTISQLFVDNKEEELSLIGNHDITTITEEEVNEAITKFACRLSNRNIQYNEEDILKTIILVNLSSLSNEKNAEIYNELLIKAGNPDINELVLAYTRIINAFNNPNYGKNEGSNYKYFYEENIPFEQLTHLGSLILDETQKEIYEDINNRLNKMSTMLDTYELDAEIVSLLKEIQSGIKGEEKYSLIDNSTILALSPRFADARGMIFMVCEQDDKCLTEESKKAVKTIAPYTTEETEFSLYGYEIYSEIAKTFEGNGITKTLK